MRINTKNRKMIWPSILTILIRYQNTKKDWKDTMTNWKKIDKRSSGNMESLTKVKQDRENFKEMKKEKRKELKRSYKVNRRGSKSKSKEENWKKQNWEKLKKREMQKEERKKKKRGRKSKPNRLKRDQKVRGKSQNPSPKQLRNLKVSLQRLRKIPNLRQLRKQATKLQEKEKSQLRARNRNQKLNLNQKQRQKQKVKVQKELKRVNDWWSLFSKLQ